jgi:catechol 2,3-dioxygenase-like lactoylglutathione lyase family enzyme
VLTGHAPFLVVPDVTATLEWYRDVLGFEIHAYFLDPEETGNATRDACTIFFNRGERARPNAEIVPPDLFDVYLYADDVEALHREWREAGAEILHEPIDRPWNLREIRVRDLNGYVLGVGEPLEGYR